MAPRGKPRTLEMRNNEHRPAVGQLCSASPIMRTSSFRRAIDRNESPVVLNWTAGLKPWVGFEECRKRIGAASTAPPLCTILKLLGWRDSENTVSIRHQRPDARHSAGRSQVPRV